MSLMSLSYLLFLGAAFVLSLLLRGRLRRASLLALNILFAVSYGPGDAILVLAVAALALGTLRLMEGQLRGKIWVPASFSALVVLLLVIFRGQPIYGPLLDRIWPGAAGRVGFPIGLSFYGLAAVGLVWDRFRGKTNGSAGMDDLNFVTFFPSLVSGPIPRTESLLPELSKGEGPGYDDVRKGLLGILWGFFMRLVLASRLEIVVNRVYGDPAAFRGILAWIGFLAYLLQLYCDFGGYSCVAIGSARLLGINLPDNFLAPLGAASVAEFWRRWHVSLSHWLRDYIYIPLGGNRRGKGRKYLNLVLTFLVSGIWHGAGLTFLIFGLLNALFQICGDAAAPLRKRAKEALRIREASRVYRFLRVFATYLLVSFSFLFFRAESLSNAADMIRSLWYWTPWVLLDGSLSQLGLSGPAAAVLLTGLLLLFFADRMVYRGKDPLGTFLSQHYAVRAVGTALFVTAVVVFGSWGPGYDASSFIYAHF